MCDTSLSNKTHVPSFCGTGLCWLIGDHASFVVRIEYLVARIADARRSARAVRTFEVFSIMSDDVLQIVVILPILNE